MAHTRSKNFESRCIFNNNFFLLYFIKTDLNRIWHLAVLLCQSSKPYFGNRCYSVGSANLAANFPQHCTCMSGWRSGVNTRLSPMRPGFDSRPGKYVSWVCGPSPTSGVFSGYFGFLPPQKPLITPTFEQFRD